ncbi:MAG: entericidin A/B family lipoprotein [Henriciella sp.]
MSLALLLLIFNLPRSRLGGINELQTFEGMLMMKRMVLALVALFAIPALSACNTIKGIGQDVEAAGDAVSDAASGEPD